MPSILPPEDSVCSTDSTQPYLPGQGASQVDPYLVAGYYAGMPDIPDVRRLQPRPVDEADRRATPAFYNPDGVPDNHTFNKSMLPQRTETGGRLSRLFGKPSVGFGANESRCFFEGEEPHRQYPLKSPSTNCALDKPRVQYVGRSASTAPAVEWYARGNGIRPAQASPGQRYDGYYESEGRQHDTKPTIAYRRNASQYTYPAASISQSTPRRGSYFDIYEDRHPEQDRHHSKLLHRRKSSARNGNAGSGAAFEDRHNESPRRALRPMTRSRQNSAARGHLQRRKTAREAPESDNFHKPDAYLAYAAKPPRTDKTNPTKLVITVPSARNAAYYNAKYPQGDSRTQKYRDDFWRLNGFEYDNHQAWREFHWGPERAYR